MPLWKRLCGFKLGFLDRSLIVEAVDIGEDDEVEGGIPGKAGLQELRTLASQSAKQLRYSSKGSGSTMEDE